MAALYGNEFVFAHIPKTGGKWVRRVLEAAGHPHQRDLSDGHAPAPAHNQWTSFCFIRHPATWLASWWAYCERQGWAEMGRLPESFDTSKPYDRMIWETSVIPRDHGFEPWAMELERYSPGFVYKFFKPYMRSVKHVGKQERLARDLKRFIGDFPEVPPFNVGDNVPVPSARLHAFLAEHEPLKKMGYA